MKIIDLLAARASLDSLEGRPVFFGAVLRSAVEIGLLVRIERFTVGRTLYAAHHYEAATILNWEESGWS